jgi:AraC family cel operon transcriptional repressor
MSATIPSRPSLAPATAFRIPWTTEGRRGGPLHIARHRYGEGLGFGLHCHEFAEVFWLESGSLDHQVNDRIETLSVGDVACVRPDDIHCGISYGSASATWINVSFPLTLVGDLESRYGPGEWPWAAGGPSRSARIGAAGLDRLRAWTQVLSMPSPRRLDLEGFLLELARLMCPAPHSSAPGGLPPWLAEALLVFADPVHLSGGVPRLAQLCGRSQAHLNRVVRSTKGRTATELVNDVRMDWAAEQLRLTDNSIAEVAAHCGLPNLGHFYRQFHAVFATTPHRYRRAAWGGVPQERFGQGSA